MELRHRGRRKGGWGRWWLVGVGGLAFLQCVHALTLPTLEGSYSYNKWPMIVYLTGTAIPCSAVFVDDTVIATAGRCVTVTDPDNPLQQKETTRFGKIADDDDIAAYPNIEVWAGGWINNATLIGVVTNFSYVYISASPGNNLAVMNVTLTDPSYNVTAVPLRTDDLRYPEYGVVVGYGAIGQEDWPSDAAIAKGVHRTADVQIVDSTSGFTTVGLCSEAKSGGEIIMRHVAGRTGPMLCVSTGDYGAALLILTSGTTDDYRLAGVGSRGNSFPCADETSFLTSLIFRNEWAENRIAVMAGKPAPVVVCPSATPSVSPSPSPSPSSTPSATMSPSPSTSPVVVVVHEIDWIALAAIGGGLLLIIVVLTICIPSYTGVCVWWHSRTRIQPKDTKDPNLEKRIEKKRELEMPKPGSAEAPPDALFIAMMQAQALRQLQSARGPKREITEREKRIRQRQAERKRARAKHAGSNGVDASAQYGLRYSTYGGSVDQTLQDLGVDTNIAGAKSDAKLAAAGLDVGK